MVNPRSMEIVEVTLPQFQSESCEVAAVVTKMPMRNRGPLQLQLCPATLEWFRQRCNAIEPGGPTRRPGTADHPPQDHIYWHKQKGGYVAKREADEDSLAAEGGDTSPPGHKYKIFKPVAGASGVQTECMLTQAKAWSENRDDTN